MATRLLGLTTPLGQDTLRLQAFHGTEAMSSLFSYQLETYGKEDSIDPAKLVGKSVTFSVALDNDSLRYFNGCVSRISAGERQTSMRRYDLTVVPQLWFLTKTADCRIFQDKTVPDIVREVLKDSGLTDFDLQESLTHPKRAYCVQYRETDFQFISRLLEEEGFHYFFEHSESKHKLVISDQVGSYISLPNPVDYSPSTGAAVQRSDHVNRWSHSHQFISGKWANTDYNFEQHPAREAKHPSSHLLATTNSVVSLPGISDYEIFDYPGEYINKADGEAIVKIRMEAEEAGHEIAYGSGNVRLFAVGHKFKFGDHDCEKEVGAEYVLTGMEHAAYDPTDFYGRGESGEDPSYENSFQCIPATVIFRPVQTTPRPSVASVQTAVVTGPPGEEIWPDKYGRIKVQFYWDRYGERDDNTTCWLRCSQISAGSGWGSMFLPRVGQEVIVTFLEGDPDRPLVTGVVYNADQMPAYSLPDEKTKSYIKTNSTKGGDGFNELRFEDKAKKEQIFIHAERDFDLRVKNDSMTTILRNRHESVGGNHREHVHKDYYLQVGGQRHTVIENNELKDLRANEFLNLEGSRIETIKKDWSLDIKETLVAHTGEDLEFVSKGTALLKSLKQLVVESTMGVSLKCGPSFITLGPSGVAISGPLVMINSGGSALSVPENSPVDPDLADEAQPKAADDSKSGKRSAPNSLS